MKIVIDVPWLVLASVIGLVIRLYLVVVDQGLYSPDELAKSVEQAHRLAFGQGIIPWEYLRGAATWVFPAAIALVMKTSSLIGLGQPWQYLAIVKTLLVLANMSMVYGVYRIVRNLDGSNTAAQIAGSMIALLGPIIYFSYRALSEVVTAPLIIFGFVFLTRPKRSDRNMIIASSFFGLALAIRLQTIFIPFVIFAWLVISLRARDTRTFLLVFAGWIAAIGLLDLFTWGSLFNSAHEYLAFNYFENGAASFGRQAIPYYAVFFWRTLGLFTPLLVFLIVASFKKTQLITISWIAFLLIHTGIAHKEARFIYAAMPLATVSVALGVDAALSYVHHSRKLLITMFSALLVITTLQLLHYTGATVENTYLAKKVSAYNFEGDQNRLLFAAHSEPDLCGLKNEISPWYYSGNYAFLDRDVPLYDMTGPDHFSHFYNYVITMNPHEGTPVIHNKNVWLVRLDTTCRHDPHYTSAKPFGTQ